MKIQISVGHAENASLLQSLAEEEINRALGRFSDRITRVGLHLRDQNGPMKEGIDQRCNIEIRVAGLDPFAVEADAETPAGAIREAVGKAQRAVERRLDKRDSFR